MCQYIKNDDGEECGRTAEPFCHDHEDTVQAKIWGRMDEQAEQIDRLLELEAKMDEYEEIVREVERAEQSGSTALVMEDTCDECEASLRVSQELREHPRFGNTRVFETVIQCDCDEHVLYATAESVADIPGGWVA